MACPVGSPCLPLLQSTSTGVTEPSRLTNWGARRIGHQVSETTDFKYFVGIDWGDKLHQVCVLDMRRKVIVEKQVKHTGEELEKLIEVLGGLGAEPHSVAVGLETPRGPIVEALLERKFAVHSLNPKQMDRFRDRHTVAGAKDDRRDAFVIADALATDLHHFRRLVVEGPERLRLRELVRTEQELAQEVQRHANRLRDLLVRYFPMLLQFCNGADEPWLWDFVAKFGTHQEAAATRRAALTALLKHHRIRRFTGHELHAALKQPPLNLQPGSAEALSAHARRIVPVLQALEAQRHGCEAESTALLQSLAEAGNGDSEGQKCEHNDVAILLSVPGVGRIVGGAVLAEAGQALAQRDYPALRALCGVAPVTVQSGGSKRVQQRRACNPRLRDAFFHAAKTAVQHYPLFKEMYARAKKAGQSYGRRLRGIGDKLLKILCAMLKSGRLFDERLLTSKSAC